MNSSDDDDAGVPALQLEKIIQDGKEGRSEHMRYRVPLGHRYGSERMSALFSDAARFGMWRRLWVCLAREQRRLGLTQVTEAAIAQMREHADLTEAEYEMARAEEARVRHDVMAHVAVFGKTCPGAAGVIHLGATSCYVTDNADLLAMRAALDLVAGQVAGLLALMRNFAREHHGTPTLGATHFQPAQPTTVGKRCTLWMQDLELDLHAVDRARKELRFRGAKGTVGTQASFLKLFNGDHERVEKLDRAVAAAFGMVPYKVTGQTYPRKVDYSVLSVLAGIGVTAHRIGTDVRLLSGLGELSEPFEDSQIGSSAMAYKRNPMRSERVCALARHLINLAQDPAHTAAVQWLERTLDDSAVRRIAIPSAFLAADAVLGILGNVFSGLRVNKAIVAARLNAEAPLMGTENIIMAMSEKGASRQETHEKLRLHGIASKQRVLDEGHSTACDFVDRIKKDAFFAPVVTQLDALLDPASFIGRAPEQVDSYLEYLETEVFPAYEKDIKAYKPAKLTV